MDALDVCSIVLFCKCHVYKHSVSTYMTCASKLGRGMESVNIDIPGFHLGGGGLAPPLEAGGPPSLRVATYHIHNARGCKKI